MCLVIAEEALKVLCDEWSTSLPYNAHRYPVVKVGCQTSYVRRRTANDDAGSLTAVSCQYSGLLAVCPLASVGSLGEAS